MLLNECEIGMKVLYKKEVLYEITELKLSAGKVNIRREFYAKGGSTKEKSFEALPEVLTLYWLSKGRKIFHAGKVLVVDEVSNQKSSKGEYQRVINFLEENTNVSVQIVDDSNFKDFTIIS